MAFEPREAMTNPGSPSRRILVIESNADSAEALCTLLEVWGHRVSFASTGARGIEMATVEAPDVIVVDLGLGDMDGSDVIRRIRLRGGTAPPWIIAYSGYNERRVAARDAGCDAFVLKPDLDGLQASIDNASIGATGSRKAPARARRRGRRPEVA